MTNYIIQNGVPVLRYGVPPHELNPEIDFIIIDEQGKVVDIVNLEETTPRPK